MNLNLVVNKRQALVKPVFFRADWYFFRLSSESGVDLTLRFGTPYRVRPLDCDDKTRFDSG